MARPRERETNGNPAMISIIGPGMQVTGDCVTDGTLRVEGTLIGTVYAGKAVVVGKEGTIHGEIRTNDALIAGEASGTLVAASRLEIQASSRVQGEIRARRLQLEEGAALNGEIQMGEVELGPVPKTQKPGAPATKNGEISKARLEMEPARSP